MWNVLIEILLEILPVPDFLMFASEACFLTSQELLSRFLLCHLREKYCLKPLLNKLTMQWPGIYSMFLPNLTLSWQGAWTRWSTEIPSNPHNYVILWSPHWRADQLIQRANCSHPIQAHGVVQLMIHKLTGQKNNAEITQKLSDRCFLVLQSFKHVPIFLAKNSNFTLIFLYPYKIWF